MVTAKFEVTEGRKEIILTVSGHAGQAEEGKDIVCAASSILAYTVAQCVSNMHKAKKLLAEPYIKLESGSAEIRVKPKKKEFYEALHTFYVAENGYMLLAQSYPDFVALIPFAKDI